MLCVTQPPHYAWSPPSRLRRRQSKLVAIVVLVSLGGGGIISSVWLLHKSASLDIVLENRYLGATAPYYIAVDGENVSVGTIGPLQEVRVSVTFTWSVASCLSHWVNGTAWAEGRTYSSDYERPIVCSGAHLSIRLLV